MDGRRNLLVTAPTNGGKSLVGLVKSEHPGALVSYANFPSTEYLTIDFTDFLCFNVYLHDQRDFERYSRGRASPFSGHALPPCVRPSSGSRDARRAPPARPRSSGLAGLAKPSGPTRR